MFGIRPDLAFSVFVVSQYASKPNPSYWQAMKHIFQYICNALSLQLIYHGALFNLQEYTDADWAGDCDTCRSTSGYIFNIRCGAISWLSKKQLTVALSSCKTKYMEQIQATKEAV